MATVRIENLTKTYEKVTAVDGLSLDIADGEFFVILGPSGAGKTTTLKSVAGLVDVDAGEVSIAGTSMEGVEPYHRNVAMAFESYALYPQKTVFDNLASPLRSGRTGKYSAQDQQQRIEAVTTTLGIDHLLKRLPRELSNGQRQRVALGRVLVRTADVYLLDEPLSHLDAKLRAAMRAELKQLGEMSSTTTLYVTHDYQEALALGDRIAVLRNGRLVQVGTPYEIWHDPVDTFVARALGQPEINLVDAAVSDGRLRSADGSVDIPAPTHLDLPDGRARLGIRPRDLGLVAPGQEAPADSLVVRGRVKLAERLGRLMEFSVESGAQELIVVADSDVRAREGDEVSLVLPLADVHVFAPLPQGVQESPDHGEQRVDDHVDTPRLGGAVRRAVTTTAGGPR
ncbi:ABC transporter ATP-binding protein [Kineococcus gynurae]|uniref:ABC transporter ATP-binding protein n=1 Tax=Kineococcus gynurae TaxID=452979 RepID=A0ABV5LPT9_9ACTN